MRRADIKVDDHLDYTDPDGRTREVIKTVRQAHMRAFRIAARSGG